MLDFLFASQDASTASLTWIFALLDQHPDVLAKVRTCVCNGIWAIDTHGCRSARSKSACALTTSRCHLRRVALVPLSCHVILSPWQVLEQLTYTRAVIKELLRFRPPATFVPQMAMEDVELTPEYTVPKGSCRAHVTSSCAQQSAGTLVVPSLWAGCHQGFPEPDKFDPERMM